MKIYDRENLEKSYNNKLNKNSENSTFAKFKDIAISAIIVASAATGLYGLHNHNIDSQVQESESLVMQFGNSTIYQLQQFETKNLELYQKNKEMLTNLQKDEALLKAMGININVKSLIRNNESKFQLADQKLKQDLDSTTKLLELKDRLPTEEEKREVYYHKPQDFENFKNANSNNLVNQQELANINANVQKHTTFVKEAKVEILKNIKEKLANKEFNLEKKKKEFQAKVTESIYDEKKGIAEIKSELEKDSDLKAAIDPKEIANSEKAIEDMEDLAMEQILKDSKLVSEMVSTLSQKGINIEQEVASAPTQTASATNSSGGFNFLQYYLMHQWLSSSNSATASMSATPSYNGGMRSAMAASNPYDFKKEGSHLNQTIIGSGVVTPSGMSYAQMHENMTRTKTHVTSYKSTRAMARSSVSVRGSSGG